MCPVSLGAAPFSCVLSRLSLQQGSQSFSAAVQDSERQKQKPQAQNWHTVTSITFCWKASHRPSPDSRGEYIKTSWILGNIVHWGHHCHRPPYHNQDYLTLCLFLSHEWSSLWAGAVCPQSQHRAQHRVKNLAKRKEEGNLGFTMHDLGPVPAPLWTSVCPSIPREVKQIFNIIQM